MYYNMMCIQKDFLHADQKRRGQQKKIKVQISLHRKYMHSPKMDLTTIPIHLRI